MNQIVKKIQKISKNSYNGELCELNEFVNNIQQF